MLSGLLVVCFGTKINEVLSSGERNFGFVTEFHWDLACLRVSHFATPILPIGTEHCLLKSCLLDLCNILSLVQQCHKHDFPS